MNAAAPPIFPSRRLLAHSISIRFLDFMRTPVMTMEIRATGWRFAVLLGFSALLPTSGYSRDLPGITVSVHGMTTNIPLRADYGMAVEGEIDGMGAAPPGAIMMFSGVSAPTGWALCDGRNGTVDLRGMFVVGYKPGDAAYGRVRDTGGAPLHTLGENQLPPHDHGGVLIDSTTRRSVQLLKGEGTDTALDNVKYEHTSLFSSKWIPFPRVKTLTAARGAFRYDDGDYVMKNGNVRLDVNKTGGNVGFDTRPPYYVVSYIQRKPLSKTRVTAASLQTDANQISIASVKAEQGVVIGAGSLRGKGALSPGMVAIWPHPSPQPPGWVFISKSSAQSKLDGGEDLTWRYVVGRDSRDRDYNFIGPDRRGPLADMEKVALKKENLPSHGHKLSFEGNANGPLDWLTAIIGRVRTVSSGPWSNHTVSLHASHCCALPALAEQGEGKAIGRLPPYGSVRFIKYIGVETPMRPGSDNLPVLTADSTAAVIQRPAKIRGDLMIAKGAEITGLGAFPMGTVILWSGDPEKLPDGWILANGDARPNHIDDAIWKKRLDKLRQTGLTPFDLGGRFPRGGVQGEPNWVDHPNRTDKLMTIDNMPQHGHTFGFWRKNDMPIAYKWPNEVVKTENIHTRGENVRYDPVINRAFNNWSVLNPTVVAADASSQAPISLRPPYRVLAYIMYVGK